MLTAGGGWSAVVELADDLDEEALALRLAEERGVLVHPGYFFDFPRGGHVVVSLLPPPADVERGLSELRALIAR
jgi:hypothetical protein